MTREPGNLPSPALFAIPDGASRSVKVGRTECRSARRMSGCRALSGRHPLTGFAMDQSALDVPPQEATSEYSGTAVTLYVCVTCRAGEDRDTVPRPGRRLHDALADAQRRQDSPPSFRIVEAECLSNCDRGCSVALTGPGRWSYVYGDLGQASVDELLAGASRYAATEDGLVPWRERPTIFRKGVIARIPPSLPPV
jgi:predicted metal-binding protein